MTTWCESGSASVKPCRGSFRRRGTNDGSANLGAILETAVEIAGAMAHLHSLDILHGDLTAANILLTSSTGELTMRVPHHNYDAHHGTICDTVKAFMWVCHGVACGQLPEVRGPG